MDDGDDGASDGYDRLAEQAGDLEGWASPWAENPLQREYSWPATRDLLPDVSGARVLDAGCGIGDHAAWLVENGADVTGVDASEEAVESARDRLGDETEFGVADLAEPLPFGDAAFDGALSHLVLDHVSPLGSTFAELERVLAADGWLVFATVHPMQYYLAYEEVERYYDRQPVEVSWDAPVTSYHRPLADVVGALVDAGFVLEELREPEPPAEYVAAAADEWNVDRRPQILCVRARATGP